MCGVFGIYRKDETENWWEGEDDWIDPRVATLPFICLSFAHLGVERTWLHHWILLIVELYNQFPKFYSIKSSVTKQDVLDAYVAVSDIISYNMTNNEKYAKYYETAQTNVENIFAPYASCDDLIKGFKERLEIGTDNISLLKKITSLLDKKDCTENEVFYTAATQLHELDPTAESAYNMGNMSIAKENYSDGVSYYNQAIQLQEDVDYKASYYLKLDMTTECTEALRATQS